MPNVDETLVASSGSVWVAPTGTAFPVSPSSAPGAGWVDLGFLTDDGIEISNSIESSGVGAWQTDGEIRSNVSSRGLRIEFTLRQWTSATLEMGLGGSVTGTGPFVFAPPTDRKERSMLVRWADGTRRFDLRLAAVVAADLSSVRLRNDTIADLAVAVSALDGGFSTASPWDLITDDIAFVRDQNSTTNNVEATPIVQVRAAQSAATVSVSSSSSIILAADPERASATLINIGDVDVWVWPGTAPTIGAAFLATPGRSLTIPGSAALHAITQAGTSSLAFTVETP